LANPEQREKVERFERYNFERRDSGREVPRFHDNDIRSIKILPLRKKNDPSTIEFIFFDPDERVERLLRVKQCANLRFSMDFDILADNTSGPTNSHGQTSNVEVSGCKDCIERALKQGMADWNVEYQPQARDTPATYRMYQLQKFILVKVWLCGGTLEIVARDFEIETNQCR